MLWVPHKGWRSESNLAAGGSTAPGTAVTTGGTSSTKGTPAELIASTAFDSYWMTVGFSNYAGAATASELCVDILTGAATESVLIENIIAGGCGPSAFSYPRTFQFPIYIPAGTRISAQAAGRRTSTAFRASIWLWGGNGSPPFRVGSRVTTYGIGTVPNGTAITPGASGAEGSWTQITASTSADHFAVIPSFQVTNNTAVSSRSFQLDMGIGAATEAVLGHSVLFNCDNLEQVYGPFPDIPFFKDIPSGSRLVLRASSSGTAVDTYDAALYCVS